MAISVASTQKAFLSCCRGGLLALAIGLAAPAAQAANAADWWVYVANDYPDDIKDLLARGSDPNVRYKNGQPAIMRAVVDGAWKVFDVLAADPRTDVNAENPARETPLMYLAIAGETERARKLIARGAQVNRLGWTPLHYAASKGQMEMARLLLANKAMANAPAPNGETPLMMAALSGRKPMVELLLKAGADVTTQDTKGQNAADWAATGKWTALSAELTTMIAQQDEAKRKRRAAARDGSQEGAAAAPEAAAPAAPAAPQDAPAPAAKAPADKSGVQGVSGVGLSDYEKPPAP
ncbi:ankyrin repeat domain-containing protein [Achromobacter sp. NPDC058515]|uniref:ankyrin repeat domain-containing protein n=1 Tax=Achromobacter sp. NPDC058515 TaxID=3346533 RepID=UPI00366267F2